MSDVRQSLDPRMIGELITKRKWWLIVPLVFTLVGAYYFIERLPTVWRVHSSVLYEERDPMSNRVEGKLLPGSRETGRSRRDDDLAKARLLRLKVLSDEFLVQIARDMGYFDNEHVYERAQAIKDRTGDPKSIEEIAQRQAAGWIDSQVDITLSGTNIYQIITEGTDRHSIFTLNERIVSKLGDIIRNEELGRIRAASTFTRQQISIYRSRTEQAKANLRRFIETELMQDVQTGTILDINQGAAARLAEETGFEVQRLGESVEEARNSLASSYSFDLDDFIAGAPERARLLEDQLASLEKQLGYLLLERTWSDPNVIRQNERIGQTRDEIDVLLSQHAGSVLADRSAAVRDLAVRGTRDSMLYRALDARRLALFQQSMGATGVEAAEISRREETREYLEEQVRINQELLDAFMSHDAATQITEAVEQDDQMQTLRVLDPANWPERPVLPNKPQNYALAVIVGLALGGAFMILREYLDTSIRDTHEAEELVGAPILGTIPRIEGLHLLGPQRRLRRGLLFAMLGVIVIGAAIGYYIMFYDRGGQSAEQETVSLSSVVSTSGERD